MKKKLYIVYIVENEKEIKKWKKKKRKRKKMEKDEEDGKVFCMKSKMRQCIEDNNWYEITIIN
jgi:hypothetical protein